MLICEIITVEPYFDYDPHFTFDFFFYQSNNYTN